MSLPFDVTMSPNDNIELGRPDEYIDYVISVITDTPEEYIATNEMLTERIQEIQQNGNPKYPWELKALQDTLSNRIAYHDSEQSDSENSSAMSVDTMSLSEDNMIVDDTPCLINDNENPVSESHSSYKRQAKKLRHEKKKLRKQLRKQELHDPSISNSEFEIAKIYAYQHFAWKQFKIKQELNIFNFKRIKNFTDGDDDLVINKECFKICNYSNTARCVYSKFLEVADNAGLLLKNGKTNDEENCENNNTKRVVKFQFNSDGILRYLIDECNMNYLNKYLEKPKDIHPTGSILLNKQTNSSESETTASKSSNTNYPFNTSCVEIFSTPNKFLHYCDNQFSLRKMSDSYIDEYVSHEEDDEYDEDEEEEEEDGEEEEDFDMEDADDYTTPNAHEKLSCRDNLKSIKDSRSISEFESDIEMMSDANEDENDKSDKKSSKKKTVRFDPIIEVFVSYSKNSTLDEIEDDLLAVEYKGVDEFQKD